MTEALIAILNYGFNIENLDTLVAKVMMENVASKKLLENLEFQSQGVIKNRGFWQEKHHDLEQFLLLKP